jgi:hypothetical protein
VLTSETTKRNVSRSHGTTHSYLLNNPGDWAIVMQHLNILNELLFKVEIKKCLTNWNQENWTDGGKLDGFQVESGACVLYRR